MKGVISYLNRRELCGTIETGDAYYYFSFENVVGGAEAFGKLTVGIPVRFEEGHLMTGRLKHRL